MKNEFKPQRIKHMSLKAAENLHKKLSKELQKANDDFTMNYNLDAYNEFTARVVALMDDLIGLERKIKK